MAALNLAAATQYDWEAIATRVRAEYVAALMMVPSAALLAPLTRQAAESREISVSTFPR